MRVQYRLLTTTKTALAVLVGTALAAPGGAQASIELAGNDLTAFPHFEYVRAINEGSPVRLAVDPGVNSALVGQTCDLYVVVSKTISGWTSDPTLTDVSSGGAETKTFAAGTIQGNTVILDSGTLSGDAGIELGVPYDMVIDVNQNGSLDSGDYIDGYDNVEAGFYVCHDTADRGPLATSESIYDLSGASFDSQDVYWPTGIATMGELPLIIVSHGHGHNYQWYDHIGEHMASYGYVVMSHQNNTGPGVESAATTTLSNTDAFLSNLGTIAGGVLQGHVDETKMTWLGHSRGGEGVVIAYDRIFDGTFTPVNYTIDDIKLVSSIAPVDFQTLPNTDPHDVNYHLWTGGSDDDVSGCASCNQCQTFHLHDRAEQYRQSISLHGVGHGDFHDGGGSSVAFGPCLVGRINTHTIMRGYFYPLVERYIDGNIPAKDYLSRQWESFRPPSAPTSACVVVDLQYRDGSAPGKFVIDDYQTNPSTTLSSLGLTVTSTVTGVVEGDMDDPNNTFTNSTDAFNGFTSNGNGADDSSRRRRSSSGTAATATTPGSFPAAGRSVSGRRSPSAPARQRATR